MQLQDAGTGVTRDSIAFFREHRHRLGDIVEATVRFPGFEDPHNPYLMMLRDTHGDQMLLSGCTAGYTGEGPRGAMQVLIESGWPPDQAALVFTTAVVHLERHTCLEMTDEAHASPELEALLHRDDVGVRGAIGAERS